MMWFFLQTGAAKTPRKGKKYPAIGTTMYSVHEHRYYIPGRAAPMMEYCVSAGTVKGFIEGRYAEVVILGKAPEGYRELYYYKIADMGKKFFYSRQEAEQLAEQKSDQYERAWGWLGEPDIPLRRSWKVKEEQNAIC